MKNKNLLIAPLLYIALYLGLMERGDGSNTGRPALFFSPMVWLKDHGYFYIRDHVFASLFSFVYTLPFLYAFEFPLWWAAPYAGGVLLGGLSGWNKWFNFNRTFKEDYLDGILRMTHYTALFMALGMLADNVYLACGASLIYTFIAPLAYWFRAKVQWFRTWTRYPSQYAEGFNTILRAVLAAFVVTL